MHPDTLFQFSGPLALFGWASLVLAPFAPRLTDWIAGLAIPVLLSVGYTVLILVYWSGAPGGYDSLDSVMLLFTSPGIALAGWVHYLAFDLFVGAWEVRVARRERIPHLLVLPCLALTFLFGPVGLVVFLGLRFARSRIPHTQSQEA